MNYRTPLYIFLIVIISLDILAQTSFRKVTEGPIVNTLTDSRSVNFADFNRDGLEDILITQGNASGVPDLIYINKGNSEWEAQPHLLSHVSDPSVGATIGDMDNDGYPDIFVASWYNKPNVLFKCLPDASFNLITIDENSYSESATWGDYNQDGFLDLYVCNSGNNATENKNYLYNNDEGTLQLANTHSLTNDTNNSRSATWVDYDNDRDVDLFICNENQTRNQLFRNDGNGSFTKINAAGVLLLEAASSMSASWADVNNDGWMDVFIANSGFYVDQTNRLYINNGDGTFSRKSGIHESDNGCSFSSSFADYDNDGDVDLFVSNGFCNGPITNFLYLNDAYGNFTRDTTSISNLQTPCSFGVAWADTNNDGFQDLVIANCKNSSQASLATNSVWMNEGNGNKWLQVKLQGNSSNSFGIGARIYTSAIINGKRTIQIRDINSVSGYCSQNSLTAHFGCKDATMVDTLIMYWPSGITQTFTNIPTNQLINIQELDISSIKDISHIITCTISPNPSNTSIVVEAAWKGNVEFLRLDILSISGELVYTSQLQDVGQSITHPIHLTQSNILPGTYILQLTTPFWQIHKKLIVAH